MSVEAEERSLWLGFRRGFAGACPDCGKARLFASYLKVVSACPACGHHLAQYRADDGPAYFTILIVGHLIIGPLLFVDAVKSWPLEVVWAIMIPALVFATLALLPRVKGAFVGVQWAVRDQGGR